MDTKSTSFDYGIKTFQTSLLIYLTYLQSKANEVSFAALRLIEEQNNRWQVELLREKEKTETLLDQIDKINSKVEILSSNSFYSNLAIIAGMAFIVFLLFKKGGDDDDMTRLAELITSNTIEILRSNKEVLMRVSAEGMLCVDLNIVSHLVTMAFS